MDTIQTQRQTQIENDTYLRIWEAEKDHARIRWTNTTFFMSISFAILGFSFQKGLTPQTSLAIRTSGLLIYWFAYILFLHFFKYTKFIRSYLLELEQSGRASLDIQSKTNEALFPRHRKFPFTQTQHLLLYFGLIYTVGVVLLWLLGV